MDEHEAQYQRQPEGQTTECDRDNSCRCSWNAQGCIGQGHDAFHQADALWNGRDDPKQNAHSEACHQWTKANRLTEGAEEYVQAGNIYGVRRQHHQQQAHQAGWIFRHSLRGGGQLSGIGIGPVCVEQAGVPEPATDAVDNGLNPAQQTLDQRWTPDAK